MSEILNTPDPESLITLLQSPQGRAYFLNFLKTEFSTENLLFWMQVEIYKDLEIKFLNVQKKRENSGNSKGEHRSGVSVSGIGELVANNLTSGEGSTTGNPDNPI